MSNEDLIRLGVIGSLVSGIICFTPLPEFVFGAVGVQIPERMLFYIFFPLLLIFGAVLVYGSWRKEKNDPNSRHDPGPDLD